MAWSPAAKETSTDGVVLWQTLPEIVYVKFETTSAWHVNGLPDANVYPVTTCRRSWYLDRNKKYPQLRVWRTQFPLAPAFAITAHVAQGQTLQEGVTTDLSIGLGGNPFTAYVAVTRVQGRNKLLIFRPFEATPFQRGVGVGRDLLLRKLRGEPIDWSALVAKYHEERCCCACHERKQKAAFTGGQWKRDDSDRVCQECCKKYAASSTPWQCNVCKIWHAEVNFPEKYRRPQCAYYRVCLTCEVQKPCARCKERKSEKSFGALAWKARNADRRICRMCAAKERGMWTCQSCGERKARAAFSVCQNNENRRTHGWERCNKCVGLQLARHFAARAIKRLSRRRQSVAEANLLQVAGLPRAALQPAPVRAAAAAAESEAKERGETKPAGTPKRKREEEGKLNETVSSKSTTTARPKTQGQENLFEYICPCCSELVTSTVRTGQVRHRGTCGGRFRVRDGRAAAKPHVYVCPFCKGEVLSNTKTGKVDHRTVCNNQFYVKDGEVAEKTRMYAHGCPVCDTVVWSSRSFGRINIKHQTSAGKLCKTTTWRVPENRPQEKS